MSGRKRSAQRDLDHVGVGVEDLAAAAAAFRRLGFAPTPLSFHIKARDDGSLYRSGTGNHCLIFRKGFVELLGVTDAAVHPGWLPHYLARYRGLHILGFGSHDIEADAARMRAMAPAIATRQLYQTMEEGSAAAMAGFGVIDIPGAIIPECHVVALEHQTRDLFFDPHAIKHPNGAVALTSVCILVARPDDFARRLASFFECAIESYPSGALLLTDLDGCRVEIVDQASLARLYPSLHAPTIPWMANFGVEVKDIERAEALLRQRAIAFQRLDGGVLMTQPEDGCGAAVVLHGTRS